MKNPKRHKLYGIIGGSLQCSLSPLIHNYLFKKYKLDSCYSTFEIKQSNLEEVIAGIRTFDISGVNVTYPFKEKLVHLLDKLDITAQKTGAVNTIKNYRGKLTGYNTDIIGVRKTLQNRLKIDIKDNTVLLLGAGGASLACLVALIRQHPDKIIIAGRDISKVKSKINRFKKTKTTSDIFPIDIKYLNGDNLSETPVLLINATSAKSTFLAGIITTLSNNKLFNKTKIFDLNYGWRALSKNNQKFPNRYVDGLYMLTAQAVESFYIWTGIKAEADDIYKYIIRKLRNNKYA